MIKVSPLLIQENIGIESRDGNVGHIDVIRSYIDRYNERHMDENT